MKKQVFYMLVCRLFSISLTAQKNKTFRGKILFLSSGKTPAVGVEISGAVKNIGNTNTIYTMHDGSYILVFPKAGTGNRINLSVGDTDSKGQH